MSNDCDPIASLVEKLVDGEASGSERRKAEAHLETCVSCRDHLGFLTALHERTRALPYPEPPAEYWERLPRRVLERVGSEALGPRRGGFRALFSPGALRWQALAATLLVLAAVGVAVYRGDALRPEEETRAIPRSVPAPEPPGSPATPAGAESSRPPMARDEPPSERPEPVAEPRRAEPRREDLSAREMEKSAIDEPAAGAPAPAAPVEVVEVQDETEEASRVELHRARERAPAPAGRDFAVASLSSAQALEDCGALRRAVAAAEAGESRNPDALYRLALCAIGEHERGPGDGTLELAIADAEKFLAVESEGPRAEEIREKLERARKR